MLDLITTNSLNAGHAVQARQSKLTSTPDQLFAESLRTQNRSRQTDPAPADDVRSHELDPEPTASRPRETSERPEHNAIEEREPEEHDVVDHAPHDNEEPGAGPPAHPVENEPADEAQAPSTESALTETKPTAEAQALAWQEHLLSLARLARGASASESTTSQPQSSTPRQGKSDQPKVLIETKPTSLTSQQAVTDDDGATKASTSATADTDTARRAPVVPETTRQTDASRSQTGEQASKPDALLATVASDKTSDQSTNNASQQSNSRLLSALKQGAQQAEASSKTVDPFVIKEPLTPAPPPTAVIKPTIATHQSPIHLQSVDAGAQGISESASAEDRGNIAALSRGLAAAVRQRGGTVNIQLTPETLGPIKITMSISQGNVSVQFDASSEQARELLNRNIESLRATLQNKGFGVERLAVQSSPQSFDSGTRDSSGQSQQDRLTQSNDHDASDGQSRGKREHDDPDSPEHHQDTNFNHHWRVAVNTTA
ncbi:MAG: flagellar hook-length control protein FliK [Phycisphaerales bacterium JB043]